MTEISKYCIPYIELDDNFLVHLTTTFWCTGMANTVMLMLTLDTGLSELLADRMGSTESH